MTATAVAVTFAVTVAGTFAVAVAVVGWAGAARAATAYRYWAYYVASPGSTTWQYSQRGPATEHPAQGEVEGWRFAVQADAGSGLLPRATPDFTALCGAAAPKSGDVRVGMVIDFGTAADAPGGETPPAGVAVSCVEVKAGSTGFDALQAAVGAANVRVGTAGSTAGLVCGIDGYPRSECTNAVAAPRSTPAAGQATPAPAPPAATTSEPTTTPPSAAATSTAATSATATSTPAPSATNSSRAPLPVATPLSGVHPASGSPFPAGAVAGLVIATLFGAVALARSLAKRGSE